MRKTGTAVVLAAMALTIGCAGADTTSNDESEVAVRFSGIADKVTVKEDSLEFDADIFPRLEEHLAKLDAWAKATEEEKQTLEPVFFVSDRQTDARGADNALREDARNPKGYLRRGVSWSRAANGNVIVMTAPASLAEAEKELLTNKLILEAGGEDEPGAVGTQALAGGRVERTPEGKKRSWTYTFGGADGYTPVDLSGKVLWEKQLLAGGNAKITLTKGRIDILPKIDAELVTRLLVPRSGKAVLSTEVLGEIEFQATADGAFEIEKGDTLYSKKFGGAVSGLPLTMSVDVKWSCGLATTGKAKAVIGATARGSIAAGASFEGLRLAPIFEKPTYTFEKIGPTLDSNVTIRGACHLISTVALEVFDAAGPNASVDLYAHADINASTQQLAGQADATIKAGVEAKVGGALKPFGIQLMTIDAEPWRYEKEVFKGAITFGQQ